MNSAKEMLSSLLSSSLEESELVVLRAMVETLQARIKQIQIIKKMSRLLNEDFSSHEQATANRHVFDIIVGGFKERLSEALKRLSEVDEDERMNDSNR